MFLTFIACILIPAYTLWFLAGSNWLTTNFSVLGNITENQTRFLIWGLLISLYFFFCLRRIAAQTPEPPCCPWTITVSFLLFILTLITPYLPDTLPIQAIFHTIFALFSSIFLALTLLLTILKLEEYYPGRFRSYLWGMIFTALVCLGLLVLTQMISSAIEIFITLSADFMVYRLYRRTVR